MTVAAIRERLYDYIRDAEDKKVEAIYTILEDQIKKPYEWSEDGEVVSMLHDRLASYKAGNEPSISLDELSTSWDQLEKDHANRFKK